MALTGACLVLFVTFHVVMNAVCILWPAAYNEVCMFLGANWYALIASAGLAALFIIHIIYAVWLTLQNQKARGADKYEVTSRPPQVEWASKNMLVLGIVVLAFLCVHMYQFWAKMQLQELLGSTATIDGKVAPPEFGTLFIQDAFSHVWVTIVYIIGFCALWFHMNHGFWSMFQTTGWNGKIWISRLKCIGCWWTSIVIGLFVIEAVTFTVQANNNYYLNNQELQNQYAGYFGEKAAEAMEEFQSAQASLANLPEDQGMAQFTAALQTLSDKLDSIIKSADALCPNGVNNELDTARNMYGQAQQFLMQMQMQSQMQGQQGGYAEPEGAEIIDSEGMTGATEPQTEN